MKVNIKHLKRDNLKPKSDKKEEKIEEVTKVRGNNLLPQEVDVTFEISEDNELNTYLVSKSKELIGIQANARLELGRVFCEVHDKLAGNKHTGLYVKWLGVNGYNKMTALRHRNRYELYTKITSDDGKMIAATAPQKLVDTLLTHTDRVNIINQLNSSITKDELVAMLEEKPSIEIVEPMTFDVEAEFNSFKNVYSRVDVNSLSKKQQGELRKLLEKFNRLFEGVEG